MGYAATPTPEGYWLEENVLDMSRVDTAAVERDVQDQMNKSLSFA